MYRLDTKQKRKEYREASINGKQTEKYKDIEILAYNDSQGRPCLKIWKGTSGYPYINYYYRDKAQQQERINKEKQRADLRQQRKEQMKKEGRTLSQSAQAAAQIKRILTKEYPKIKFSVSVVSGNYSMGSRVSYIDGPPSKDIQDFVDQFQYGHFNGMEDIYEISNSKDMPQAKYCFAERTISDKIYEDALEFAKQYFGFFNADIKLNDYLKDCGGTVRNYLWRTLNKMDLTNGFNKEEFKKKLYQY
jgi:hypothetical protein